MKRFLCIVVAITLMGTLVIPCFAVEPVPTYTEAVAEDVVLQFFPALFEGLTSLLQTPPMLYLFGIFILAFIILAFKVIFKSR